MWRSLLLIGTLVAAVSAGHAGATDTRQLPHGGVFNVREFGAAGDGATLDTAALNRTIRTCSQAGGGIVFVPAGKYLTGTLLIGSNVTLWLAPGATILGSKDLRDYQSALTGAGDWFLALILIRNARNVTITGEGTIDGNKVYNPKGDERIRGPHTILVDHSQSVSLRQFHIVDSSNFAMYVRFCQDVDLDHVSVRGGWDGIHMYGARHVSISNCKFWTGDDGIAGCRIKNIIINGCLINSSANGFRIGGEDVMIANCQIYGPGEAPHRTSGRTNLEAAINIFNARYECGSGPQPWMETPTERPIVDNLTISNVRIAGVRTPLSLRPWSHGNVPVGRIVLNNVTATQVGKVPVIVSGTEENPIGSLVFNDVRMSFAGAVEPSDVTSRNLNEYLILPAYAFHIARTNSVEFHNTRIEVGQSDCRPVLLARDVATIEFDGFTARNPAAETPSFTLDGVKHVIDRRREMPLSDPVIVDARDSRAIAGDEFTVQATARNRGSAGFGEVGMAIGDLASEEWIWIERGATAPLEFRGQVRKQPGAVPVKLGSVTRTLTVEPRPSTPRCTFRNLSVTNVAPGKFEAEVMARNIGVAGTVQVPLRVNGRVETSEEIRLGAGEDRRVAFARTVPAAGRYQVAIGDIAPQSVEIGAAVSAPYRTFANTSVTFQQIESGFYVRADGPSVLYLDDEYGTVYLKDGAREDTVAVAKLENPGRWSGWGGRAGLVFRNDLAAPGKSTGYVALVASGANGWSLEWDSDGDGRIDRYTELDGYTAWPHWLKLERRGQHFTGYASKDGRNWNRIGEADVPTAAPTQDVGLLATSAKVRFLDVRISGLTR